MLGGGNTALAQTVRDVTARQRWPWNNLVDIDYMIEGVGTNAEGLCIHFEIEDPLTGVKREAAALDRDPILTDGTHRVTWDPGADGVSLEAEGAVCRAVLRRDDPKRYMVIDLSGGPGAESYPVRYRPGIPGWTDEYKTSKLVLRKIDPGTFDMGSPTDEAGRNEKNENRHSVTLTRPFYIGVFEVTQDQYERVTGENPSVNKGPCRPVENISYNAIRGVDGGANWPASSDVDTDSFLGKIRQKTGRAFDLPTEAQWEYACRAGTKSALNNGKELSSTQGVSPEMDEVGRYVSNASAGKGGYSEGVTKAGSYLPNAWGLYDMHGNAWEWCLDWYKEKLEEETDPAGPTAGDKRVIRGGGSGNYAKYARSATRVAKTPKTAQDSYGFRLSLTLPEPWQQ